MVDNDSRRSYPQGDSLRETLSRIFAKNIFANRYTIHPEQVNDIVERLVESFTAYLTDHEDDAVRELGDSLARSGLGIRTLMESVAELRRSSPDSPWPDSYAAALAEGYASASESEILSEQEGVRRALTAALEARDRELLVKNQAVDSSINGILLADSDGTITYVNRSFLTMWGYESDREITGKQVGDLWAEDERQDINERLMRAGGWRGELASTRADGSAITVSFSASSVLDANGAPVGIMASFVDITESKRLELEMQQVQTMDDLGQLASGIVHDFNNLLAAIGGYLQLVLLEKPENGPAYRDLQQIKSAVDRGADLTKQLSYFTRQTSGKRDVVNLNEVAAETYELMKRTFPRTVDVQLETFGELWNVEADPDQMSQVIMNLCANACDAVLEMGSAEGANSNGRVSIQTENVELSEHEARKYAKVEPGRYVALRITDTGTGMEPETQRRLFVPFFTTKKKTSGTGLGLAVVYGIVHSHHGFVDVRSAKGSGTSICVYLPIAGTTSRVEPRKRPETVLVQGRGRVLVVDDDPGVREVIVRSLSLSGYEVLQAASGRGALERYREKNGDIDLVILDMVMPEMDGEETLTHLRKIDPDITALFITGYLGDDRLQRIEQAGLAEVLEKPVDLRHLSERVNALTGPLSN